MQTIPEIHQYGYLSIENLELLHDIICGNKIQTVDFGLQTHHDGRVWVCINGIAFLRFKPKSMSILHHHDKTETNTDR
jgi:hypothetical protein